MPTPIPTPSPLHQTHTAAEAYFLNYGPPQPPELQTPIVETFGQLDMEYAALRKAAVIFDEPHMATLKITGPDRHAFLNNMLTNKIDDLKPNQSLFSFWLNRQGKIDADLRLIETPQSPGTTYIILDRHLAQSTTKTLSDFIFAEDIQIEIDHTLHLLSIHGPTTFKTLNIQPIDEHTNTTIKINNTEIIIDRSDLTGEVGLNLLVPTNQLESLYQHLTDTTTNQAKPTGWLAINTARIEAGHPLYNIDFGPDTLPAETGIMNSRVNLTKGCYLGQEVVARMHARNIRKQSIVALRLDAERITTESQSILQPLTGSHINLPDQQAQTPIGAITSSTISPMLGAIPICFAMLKDAHTKPGTKLIVWAEGKYADCQVQDSLTFWTKPNN